MLSECLLNHAALTPHQKSDVNLSVLKILRIIQSDTLYRTNLRSDHASFDHLCCDYLSSSFVHPQAKLLVQDIFKLKYPLATLQSIFGSNDFFQIDQKLVIAYIFGDILTSHSFSWDIYLATTSPSSEYLPLYNYLKSRYINYPKPFVDHPFYPTASSIDQIPSKIPSICFSPYFTISFGHLTEVLAECAFFNNYNDSSSPSIIFDPRIAVNNSIIDLLISSKLLKPVRLNTVQYGVEFFRLLDTSYEFENLSAIRAKSAKYMVANDTIKNQSGSFSFNDKIIGQRLCETLLGSMSSEKLAQSLATNKPIPVMVHVRTQNYKQQPHMNYRCSEPTILARTLSAMSKTFMQYPAINDFLPSLTLLPINRRHPMMLTCEHSQFLSLLLAANFIGTNSGPGHLAPALGISTLLVNTTSLASSPIFNRNCLISLKRIIYIDPTDFANSIEVLLDCLFADWSLMLVKTSLKIRQLSSVELAREFADFNLFCNSSYSSQWPFTLQRLLSRFNTYPLQYGDIFLTSSSYSSLSRIFDLF